ncbi:hypothetical protein Tco_1060638 [Tanacetum coccineum]
MSALKFASSHNMVAFLDKPIESDGFEKIVDFLNVQIVNREVQIQALVYKKKVIIIETSIRRDLQLADKNGTECLPNATIFVEPERMGYLRFVLVLMDKQVEGMTKHKKIYAIPSHTKKVFANIKRQGKDFSGRDTHLFPTMIVQAQEQEGGEPMVDETKNVESVPTHSNDPLLSGEDRLKLNEMMEDASKQERKIADIDAVEEVTLIDETQGRNDDNLMFDTKVLDEQEVEVEKVVSTAEVTTASATTTTTVVTRPKAREAKDKGKAKMVEPEKPLKKKDQILIDEEIAQRLQEELQVKLEEEKRLERQKEEDANITEWDNVQAMIDADYKLAARLQA